MINVSLPGVVQFAEPHPIAVIRQVVETPSSSFPQIPVDSADVPLHWIQSKANPDFKRVKILR